MWVRRVEAFDTWMLQSARTSQLQEEADFDPAAAARAAVRRRVMDREWAKLDKRSEEASDTPILTAGELARLEKAERDNAALHTTRAKIGARRFLTGDGGAASSGGADMSKLSADEALALRDLLAKVGITI
jgi:hypothetical protein